MQIGHDNRPLWQLNRTCPFGSFQLLPFLAFLVNFWKSEKVLEIFLGLNCNFIFKYSKENKHAHVDKMFIVYEIHFLYGYGRFRRAGTFRRVTIFRRVTNIRKSSTLRKIPSPRNKPDLFYTPICEAVFFSLMLHSGHYMRVISLYKGLTLVQLKNVPFWA